jgi:putative flippase GtrA
MMKAIMLKFIGIIRFSVSSLACAATDLAVFTLLSSSLFDQTAAGILASTATARCFSGILNFTLNKKWCFASRGSVFNQAAKYGILFVTQMLLSWLIVTFLSQFPANLTLWKMLTDGGLFILSYFVQRKLVFKGPIAASSH